MGADYFEILSNLFYLSEHKLVACRFIHDEDGMDINGSVRITADGLDFLEADGGLSAILGTVTIKFHEDSLKQLIELRLNEAQLPKVAAARYWNGLVNALRGEQAELRGRLAREEQLTESLRTRADTLRTSLHQEQAEHNTIVQDLLDELQRERSHGLTHADNQMLVQVAHVLGHAATQARKTGTSKINQFAAAQSQVTELAIRAHTAATAPKLMAALAESDITDTDMIEWLEKHARCYGEPESVFLEFPVVVPASGLPHVRDILSLAVEQQRTRQREDQHSRAEALSTWERVDSRIQPAAPMCM